MNESRFSRIDRECPAFFVDAWEAANPEDRAAMIAFVLGLPLDYPALALVANDRRSELLAASKDAIRLIEQTARQMDNANPALDQMDEVRGRLRVAMFRAESQARA